MGKVSNGFVVECRVPLKPVAKATEKMVKCCCLTSESSCEKQYIAKDAKELAELIADIIPLLSEDFKDEDEFDKAFKEATAEMKGGM